MGPLCLHGCNIIFDRSSSAKRVSKLIDRAGRLLYDRGIQTARTYEYYKMNQK